MRIAAPIWYAGAWGGDSPREDPGDPVVANGRVVVYAIDQDPGDRVGVADAQTVERGPDLVVLDYRVGRVDDLQREAAGEPLAVPSARADDVIAFGERRPANPVVHGRKATGHIAVEAQLPKRVAHDDVVARLVDVEKAEACVASYQVASAARATVASVEMDAHGAIVLDNAVGPVDPDRGAVQAGDPAIVGCDEKLRQELDLPPVRVGVAREGRLRRAVNRHFVVGAHVGHPAENHCNAGVVPR